MSGEQRDEQRIVAEEIWSASTTDDGLATLTHRPGNWTIMQAADARIASCAPEALRMLQEMEWSADGGYCHSCQNGFWGGHRDNCAWVALMKKASL